MILYNKHNERHITDLNAKLAERGISYNNLQELIREQTGEDVSYSTLYRTLNVNDDYSNEKALACILQILKPKPQWRRLLDWYEDGRTITQAEATRWLGITQIHARHLEIQKYTDYNFYEEGDVPIFPGICSRWEGSPRYKRYFIKDLTNSTG